ncbi:MAG: hypothetical protein SF028_00185 [Candidatus Sumerlaeia bacterium]|nr:hypothetical protein [Candidatus Sumerlaeia bacterium]
MSAPRKYWRLASSFGPSELFRALRETAESRDGKKVNAAFDFDWMKRRLEIRAKDRCAAEDLLEAFLLRAQRAGCPPDGLLPGKAEERADCVAIPVGVLVNTPEMYAEIIGQSLVELGGGDVRLEFNGCGFSYGATVMARTLAFGQLAQSFPLPPYMSIAPADPEE